MTGCLQGLKCKNQVCVPQGGCREVGLSSIDLHQQLQRTDSAETDRVIDGESWWIQIGIVRIITITQTADMTWYLDWGGRKGQIMEQSVLCYTDNRDSHKAHLMAHGDMHLFIRTRHVQFVATLEKKWSFLSPQFREHSYCIYCQWVEIRACVALIRRDSLSQLRHFLRLSIYSCRLTKSSHKISWVVWRGLQQQRKMHRCNLLTKTVISTAWRSCTATQMDLLLQHPFIRPRKSSPSSFCHN